MSDTEEHWERYHAEYQNRTPSSEAAGAVTVLARRVARRLVTTATDADDVAQTVHLKLVRTDLRGVTAFKSYVIGAARNEALGLRRTEKRRQEVTQSAHTSTGDTEVDTHALPGGFTVEFRDQILSVVRQWLELPGAQRRLRLLRKLIETPEQSPLEDSEATPRVLRERRHDLAQLYVALSRVLMPSPAEDAPKWDKRRDAQFVGRLLIALGALRRSELAALLGERRDAPRTKRRDLEANE